MLNRFAICNTTKPSLHRIYLTESMGAGGLCRLEFRSVLLSHLVDSTEEVAFRTAGQSLPPPPSRTVSAGSLGLTVQNEQAQPATPVAHNESVRVA